MTWRALFTCPHEAIFEMPNQVKKAMKKRTPPERFDAVGPPPRP
jgi:hypothetical protein